MYRKELSIFILFALFAVGGLVLTSPINPLGMLIVPHDYDDNKHNYNPTVPKPDTNGDNDQAASDAEAARQQAESDAESARQQAESDANSNQAYTGEDDEN